jgi:hypothetical protein
MLSNWTAWTFLGRITPMAGCDTFCQCALPSDVIPWKKRVLKSGFAERIVLLQILVSVCDSVITELFGEFHVRGVGDGIPNALR